MEVSAKSSAVWKVLNSISISLASTQWYHHSESGVWVLKEPEKTIRAEITEEEYDI